MFLSKQCLSWSNPTCEVKLGQMLIASCRLICYTAIPSFALIFGRQQLPFSFLSMRNTIELHF